VNEPRRQKLLFILKYFHISIIRPILRLSRQQNRERQKQTETERPREKERGETEKGKEKEMERGTVRNRGDRQTDRQTEAET